MKWKVRFWNDSIRDFQTFYYPNRETALRVAESFAAKLRVRIFITNGELLETLVIG